MDFSEEDKMYMKMAIEEAILSDNEGNFPVGAVLVVDGKLIGKERNTLFSNKDWMSHAEMNLIKKYSSLVKENVKSKNSVVTIYTSLEPCLMCFGVSVLNRISKIIYACPDPFTGAAEAHLENILPVGYKKIWPKIYGGLMRKDSYDLVFSHMQRANTDKWNEAIDLYKRLGF